MSTKFYVYGGGRWRELDVNTGRVSGWAKSARLVVARGGRLECPRTGPVLRALQALAAGEPSRVRDGPRLPHTSREEEQHQSQRLNYDSACGHCCYHGNNAVLKNMCKHVPTLPQAHLSLAQPLPRQPHASTRALQTDDVFDKLRNEHFQQREPNLIHAQRTSLRKRVTAASSVSGEPQYSVTQRRKRLRISSDSSVEFVSHDIISDKHERPKTVEKRPDNRGRPPRRALVNILGFVTAAVSEPNINTKAPIPIVSAKWNATSTPNNTSTVRHNGDVNCNLQPLGPNNISKQSIISTRDNDDSQGIPDQIDVNRAGSESRSKTDDEKGNQTTEASAMVAYSLHDNGQGATKNQSRRETPIRSTEVCKELVIEESDVMALRGFLKRCAPGVSLRRFDSDDEYKRGIFYRINPLVSVERSERIQRMLSGADDISLRDFASQLGLRSVSDGPPPSRDTPNGMIAKPCRTRKQPDRYSEKMSQQSTESPVNKSFMPIRTRTRQNSVSKSYTPTKRTSDQNTVTKSSAPTKTSARKNGVSKSKSYASTKIPTIENTTSMVPAPTKSTAREDDVSKSYEPPKSKAREVIMSESPAPKKTTTYENGVLPKSVVSSSNDVGVPKSGTIPQPTATPTRDQPRRKSKIVKPTTYKAGKEYSRLEDAAIVSWVSSEGRARLVNGNRVWRELQDQYENLTGQGRTWQSLRNRYLRYILPSLSSLAVSPVRASRLRAAAAAGEIKSKRRPSRRNSMFETPGVRGAWSRRPRPRPAPHSPTPAPVPTPSRKEGGRKSSTANETSKRKRSSSSSSSSSSSFVRGPKLRYSEVTRQFAGRQAARYSTHSDSSRASSPSSPSSPPPTPPTTRTRRLFNPKTVL